jgi:hypothetical protein
VPQPRPDPADEIQPQGVEQFGVVGVGKGHEQESAEGTES